MKTVRPRPWAILSLAFCAALALVGLRVLFISYTFKEGKKLNNILSKGDRLGKMETEIEEKAKPKFDYVSSGDKVKEGKASSMAIYRNNVLQSVKQKDNSIFKNQSQVAKNGNQLVFKGAIVKQMVFEQQIMNEEPLSPSGINTTSYPILYNSRFVPSRRIVHLDLKGAPPKVYYFEKFFQLISRLGATGLLIEWEDTFPYTGELAECRSGNGYSEAEVRMILGWAKKYNLEVIPLVQTFGHLEWVLKHGKFAHLREVERYAQVICLSNPEAIQLVKTIIDQVLAIHQQYDDSSFFHMGADEAFQVGMCERCTKVINQNYTGIREKLMLNHIKTVAGYVKGKYDRRVLTWHDMLNGVPAMALNVSKIGEYVEPVVWAYAERVNEYLHADMWQKFSQSFPFIWSASAFKGADGPDRFHSNLLHYMKNHFSWSMAMNDQYRNFQEFRGIILTGWQRFDHFAILCELLPVGIPSLAVNLQILTHGGMLGKKVLNETSRILGCRFDININARGVQAYGCSFDGYGIYYNIQQLKTLHDNAKENIFDDSALRGWIGPFNTKHNYTSAWYLDQISQKIEYTLARYVALYTNLKSELMKVFNNDTVDEFLMEYYDVPVQQLVDIRDHALRLAKIKVFPARPFPIENMFKLEDFVTTISTTTTTTTTPAPEVKEH